MNADNPIIKTFLEYGAISVDDNVYHCARAFVANSILRDCEDKVSSGDMSRTQYAQLALIVDKYLNQEFELFWKEGELCLDDFHEVSKFADTEKVIYD